jgi:hypothetical protein
VVAVVVGGGLAAVRLGGCFATAGVVAGTVAIGGGVGAAGAAVVAAAVAVAVATGVVAAAGGVGETAGALSAGFSVTIVHAGMTTARPRANISALCSIFMTTTFKLSFGR